MYKRLSKQIMSKAACTRDKEILSRRDALLRLGGLAGATMIAGGMVFRIRGISAGKYE